MPAVPSPIQLLGSTLVQRSTNLTSTNATLEVVCAWPVSGQYGPGTRILYYASMAACIFARRTEWIKSACLAAALLLPAVAALHAIVLATLHRNGAVDMDVYGAFQLCAIGILTAPATVRLSKTYFNNPGRDIIFLWTALLLAGLLSLTVEFIRLDTTICPAGDPATIQWAANQTFLYTSTCGMTCGDGGPSSPLRQDAANNIYVIPVPQKLTFNTATLMAAACCIPAILSLVSMWIKILEDNWKKIQPSRSDRRSSEQAIDATWNGATPQQMTGIANRVRKWLTLIETPVFAGAVSAILIKGEMNFWSGPVKYQTEPIQSIGQWAPIVGTGLAAIGSLYLLLATDMALEDENDQESDPQVPNHLANGAASIQCEACNHTTSNITTNPLSDPQWSSESERNLPTSAELRTATGPSITTPIRHAPTNQSEKPIDKAGRRKVARILNVMSRQLTTKAHFHMEDSGFNEEKSNWPQVPGEPLRNERLPAFERTFKSPRSRSPSFVGSEDSDPSHGEGSSKAPTRTLSLQVPTPARTTSRRLRADTLPSRRNSFDRISQHSGTVTPRILCEEPDNLTELSRLGRSSGQPPAETSFNALGISLNIPSGTQTPAPQIVVSPEETDINESGLNHGPER